MRLSRRQNQAIYSVEKLKPHGAWTLVTSAYQVSYALGAHIKKSSDAAGWCDTSNPLGLMFWVIYFLEKTLCLRLGRCSTIPDGEITVMLPGGSPGLDYSRSMVKFARLAGSVYEKLYGAQALANLKAHGRLPVPELSQELDTISDKSQKAIVSDLCILSLHVQPIPSRTQSLTRGSRTKRFILTEDRITPPARMAPLRSRRTVAHIDRLSVDVG